MRKLILLLALTLFVSACKNWVPIDIYNRKHSQNTSKIESTDPDIPPSAYTSPAISEYTLLVIAPLWMYGPDGVGETRYEDIPEKDTVYFVGSGIGSSGIVLYKSTPVWVHNLSVKTQILESRIFNLYEKVHYKPLRVVDYNGKFKPKKVEEEEPLTPSHEVIRQVLSGYEPSNSKPGKSSSKTTNYSPNASGSSRRSSSSSETIYTGPRGGRYYINSNGNKTYLKSSSSSTGSYNRSKSSNKSSSYRRRR